jgi:hypothetical protein
MKIEWPDGLWTPKQQPSAPRDDTVALSARMIQARRLVGGFFGRTKGVPDD